ncbi:putative protein kinase-like domain superfamily [Helianthus annuus]|uniref:Protein kinase domain-containing protein n=1 Tax=Helianthus annuus TaxID=4232 RepID=A0A251TQ90_HELAN|nr:putative protein kinase-like domain superfamily [Helianthus annuus]KAJ0514621.1 putative protein kinase-like domain superfamily [Helianthus annuus]KAJ0530766.1 putative protein kinase-like domain superfamily [Helianthus annuus]
MKLITLKFLKFKSHFFHYCNWVNTRSEEHSVKAISAKLSTLKTSKPDTRLPSRSSKKPGSRTLISQISFHLGIKREIAILKILKHPNVVRLHETLLRLQEFLKWLTKKGQTRASEWVSLFLRYNKERKLPTSMNVPCRMPSLTKYISFKGGKTCRLIGLGNGSNMFGLTRVTF